MKRSRRYLPSQRAQKEYYRLVYETRENSNHLGHMNWGWANMFLQKETKNLIVDLLFIAERSRLHDVRAESHGIEPVISSGNHNIIINHLKDRLSTYSETLEDRVNISTL